MKTNKFKPSLGFHNCVATLLPRRCTLCGQASRCAKFRFKPLNFETQLSRLIEIKAKENVVCVFKTFRLVVFLNGDPKRNQPIHSDTYL
jgi:hypothetical protein